LVNINKKGRGGKNSTTSVASYPALTFFSEKGSAVDKYISACRLKGSGAKL
jgi:hypothetical protein